MCALTAITFRCTWWSRVKPEKVISIPPNSADGRDSCQRRSSQVVPASIRG
jgi:hypothetical protein